MNEIDAQAVIDALRRQLSDANYQRALAEAQAQQYAQQLQTLTKEAERGEAHEA